MIRLFDEFERHDPSPANGEDSFAFLNRVSSIYWSRLRDELELWFSDYPSNHQFEFRSRFRDPAPALHWAAWWELYLYRLFTRLGYAIEVHPVIATGSHKPDFRVQIGGQSVIVEAVTAFSDIVEEGRHPTLEAHLLRIVAELRNPDFFIHLEFDRVGTQAPKVREVNDPIAAWLQSLDPDVVIQSSNADVSLPESVFSIRDWQIRVSVLPVRPESRGNPNHRVLGMGPTSTGYVNDVDKLRSAIERKSKHYGDLGVPFVVAALSMAPGMGDEDVHDALSGRIAVRIEQSSRRPRAVRLRDGVWNRQPMSSRVSALLSGLNLLPWSCVRSLPKLWTNPVCDWPLAIQVPLPTGHCTPDGNVQHHNESAPPAERLGLPADWPGPEAPFPQRRCSSVGTGRQSAPAGLYELGEYDEETLTVKPAEIRAEQGRLREQSTALQGLDDAERCRVELFDMLATWDESDGAQRTKLRGRRWVRSRWSRFQRRAGGASSNTCHWSGRRASPARYHVIVGRGSGTG